LRHDTRNAKERIDFERRIDQRLELMAQEPADLIRAMQPYKRVDKDPTLDVVQDPLWIMFKLDIIDKHRVVLTTNEQIKINRSTISGVAGKEPEVCEMVNPRWEPFVHDQKIFEAAFGIDQMSHPDVKFHLDATVEVQFAETDLWCDGRPVIGLLGKLIEFIEKVPIGRLAKYVV
jgi:hypothetical protein